MFFWRVPSKPNPWISPTFWWGVILLWFCVCLKGKEACESLVEASPNCWWFRVLLFLGSVLSYSVISRLAEHSSRWCGGFLTSLHGVVQFVDCSVIISSSVLLVLHFYVFLVLVFFILIKLCIFWNDIDVGCLDFGFRFFLFSCITRWQSKETIEKNGAKGKVGHWQLHQCCYTVTPRLS